MGINSEFERIQSSETHAGSVFHIQLNAPKANILDSNMVNEIKVALEDAGSRQECKLVVFEAAGPHFSFGASVEEHRKEKVAGMLRNFHDLFLKLIDLSLPTLAVVRGQCLGGGLELARLLQFCVCRYQRHFRRSGNQTGRFPSHRLPGAAPQDRAGPC